MRERFAAVMLAAAPPKSPPRRSRTSTKTSVSPSRATRSISPQRCRQLRSTIVSPRCARKRAASASAAAPAAVRGVRGGIAIKVGGRWWPAARASMAAGGDDLAVAKLQQRAPADELARGLEREAPGSALELERRRRAIDERAGDVERVDAECVQTVER